MQQNTHKPNWRISGTAKSGGGEFNRVTILGEATVDGDMTCEQLKLMGTLDTFGSIKMKTAKLMGTMSVTGDVHADHMNLLGELTVYGDCNAEVFKSRGAFEIEGMLNAGQIEISLYGLAHAREIGGSTIHVKPHFKLFSSGARQLTVDTIEGDDIRLVNTSARVVRGSSVYIGPGCEIDMVEYTESFKRDENAVVSEQAKI